MNELVEMIIDWKGIFANHISDRDLVSRIKNYQNSTVKEKNSNQTMCQKDQQTFHQRGIRMPNKYMKRCPNSLMINKMYISHNTPIGIAKIKKKQLQHKS